MVRGWRKRVTRLSLSLSEGAVLRWQPGSGVQVTVQRWRAEEWSTRLESRVLVVVGGSAVQGEEGPIKPLVTALGLTASKPASSCSQG